ncbi:hypothetical protein [Alkalibacillus almallahensis]|uniref:hypothetical protein n=1 Tax=Alkalibacillus almallahensis TaxID=1379154 RepID=UPI00142256CB|nr:hypothetical protein [Alkalibacillus almallahensis]NIK13168.1 hypothetical protein [Alkalibacillus almallahensis]
MDLLTRFLTAILSAVIFSIGTTLWLTDWVNPFWMEAFIVGVYALGSLLIAGIPYSYLADWIMSRLNRSTYWGNLLLYALGGLITNPFLLLLMIDQGFVFDARIFAVLGVIAALIFYHVKISLTWAMGKLGSE